MKNLWFLGCALGAGCVPAFCQTNALPGRSRLYSLPRLELRSLALPSESSAGEPNSAAPEPVLANGHLTRLRLAPGGSEPPELTLPSLGTVNASFQETTLSSRERDFDLRVFQRLDQAGYFTRAQPESDSPIVRWADKTLQPVEYHLGKTILTCSFLTALKRKNPLCLINPIFLNVSW